MEIDDYLPSLEEELGEITAMKEWEGTAIDRSALMNAIWEFMPQYAMSLNGQKDVDFKTIPSDFRERTGINPLPRSDGRRVIGMYPGAGTEFLLLK